MDGYCCFGEYAATVDAEEIENQLRTATDFALVLMGRNLTESELCHTRNEAYKKGRGVCLFRNRIAAIAEEQGIDGTRVIASCWGLSIVPHIIWC